MKEKNDRKKAIIILPTYNEKDNIVKTVEKIKKLNIIDRLLFIDDNSPDGTGELLEDLAKSEPFIRVIHRPGKMGLGTAYIEGFKYALKERYDFILEMDVDGQHNPEYLKDLIGLCEKNDLVIGSRYKNGIRFFNITLWRIILATLANQYIKFLTGMNIEDSTSGYRCFRREVLEAIDLDKIYSKAFAFQIEMAYRAWKKGFKLYEYPIIFYNRNCGVSKMSYRIILEAFFMVVKLKLQLK